MALRTVAILFIFLMLSTQLLSAQSFLWQLNWENDRAISLRIISGTNLETAHINVRLSGNEQSILGKLAKNNDTLEFVPIVPFSLNKNYQVYQSKRLLFDFSVERELSALELIEIYPLGNEVPSNFLKFYLKFNQPVGESNPYDKVSILRDGKEIEEAILPLSPALWNEDYTILTVWIAPGRVKSDLGPNEMLGEVLREGDLVTIEVEPMRAKSGSMMQTSKLKKLVVLERDNEKPIIDSWAVKEPKLQSEENLQIHINEPMDYLSTLNGLRLYLGSRPVTGGFEMIEENLIVFTPDNKWKKGKYQILVGSQVEDLAANSFERLFEKDLTKNEAYQKTEDIMIEFTIK
jgi:hypothetical protein